MSVTFRIWGILAVGMLIASGMTAPARAAKKNSNALATIVITQRIGEPLVYSGPATGSTPDAPYWNCQSSSSGTSVMGTFTVTCTPTIPAPVGQWLCPDPLVRTSYFGDSATVTTRGSSSCGTSTASCQPQLLGVAQNYCEWHSGDPGPMPFICSVDYSYGADPRFTGQTSDWTVSCRTYFS